MTIEAPLVAIAVGSDGSSRTDVCSSASAPVALVTWALASNADDYSAAIGDVVAAGLDTDCNGATVGALWAQSVSAVGAGFDGRV